MQRRHVVLDRPNSSQVDRVVLDGPRFCGGDLSAFVALHRCQSGQNDLVGALTPGGPDLEDQAAGAGLDPHGGGVSQTVSFD